MELLKCEQCGDSGSAVLEMVNLDTGEDYNICCKCYVKYAVRYKRGKADNDTLYPCKVINLPDLEEGEDEIDF